MEKTKKEKRVSRGAFLKGAGAALVLVAAGGAYRAADQGVFSTGSGPAYEPWDARLDAAEGPTALVSATILASNAHNSQPWLFRVSGPASGPRIDLFADRRRNIGAIDPFLREMYVSVGCALENLALAASANGYAPKVSLVPDPGDPSHAARVELVATAEKPAGGADLELFRAIPKRHTDRFAYDAARPLPPGTTGDMDAAAGKDGENAVRVFWFEGEAGRERVGGQIVRATEALIADERQSSDSFAWFESDWDELQRERSGPTLDANVPSPLALAAAKALPGTSREQGDRIFLQNTRDVHVATAAAFGILAVRDDRDDAQRISGGRAWQRMHLLATARGLAMQPLNQMPERADREAELGLEPDFGGVLGDLVGEPGWRALMPFRIGHPTAEARLSPRRAVEDVLKK